MEVCIIILITTVSRLAHWISFLKASFGLLEILHSVGLLFLGLVLISVRGDTNSGFSFVALVVWCYSINGL